MKAFIEKALASRKILVLADQLVFSGGSFALTLLLARLLGPSDFGVYSALILVVYLLISLLNALIIQPYQVSSSRFESQSSYKSFNFMAQILFTSLVSVGLVAISSTIGIKILEGLESRWGMALLVAGFLMLDFFRKMFLANDEVLKALIIDIITISSSLIAIAIAYQGRDYSLAEIIGLLGLAYLPALSIGIILLKPSLKIGVEWISFAKLHFTQGKWLLLTALVQWWSGNLFVVMSGIFLGVKALGAFRLVQSLFGLLNVLLQTFENYVLPNASRILAGSAPMAKNYLKRTSLQAAAVFGVLLMALFIFPQSFITLAGGSQYSEFAYVVRGMVILYVIIFLGYPIRLAMRMLVLNRNFFFGYLLSLGFSLISFQYLLKNWSLIGAIAGLIASQLIVLTYWQLILHKNKFNLWK